MALGSVELPFTGAGDITQDVAVDDAGAGGVIQLMKLAISAEGQAILIPATLEGIYVLSSTRTEDPHSERVSSVNLGAGISVSLDCADIGVGKTGKLVGFEAGSSVPLRVDIETVSPARVARTTLYSQPGRSDMWRTPAPDFIELTGGAGRRFGVTIKNLSAYQPSDVNATFYWDEV